MVMHNHFSLRKDTLEMKRTLADTDTSYTVGSSRKGFNLKLLLIVPATLLLGASAFFIVRRKTSLFAK